MVYLGYLLTGAELLEEETDEVNRKAPKDEERDSSCNSRLCDMSILAGNESSIQLYYNYVAQPKILRTETHGLCVSVLRSKFPFTIRKDECLGYGDAILFPFLVRLQKIWKIL